MIFKLHVTFTANWTRIWDDKFQVHFCVLTLKISNVEGLPEYPEFVTIKDETGNFSELAGVYERQEDSHVWKYGEFEFAFTGKY